MSDSPPRLSLFPAVLMLLSLTAAVERSSAQELSQIVPSDAYSYMHVLPDPSMDFVHQANMGVWKAIQDASLHESVLTLLRANDVPDEDLAQVEGLISLCSKLLGDVEWSQFVENEMVYAEFPVVPYPGIQGGVSSVLMACRPQRELVPGLERSMIDLMQGVAGITPELSLSSSETSAVPPTRVHSLLIGKKYPILQLGVRDDIMLAGFGATVFGRALDQLEGRSDDALVDTPRFLNAVGELPAHSNQFVYFDIKGLIDYLFEQIGPQLQRHSDNDWLVRQGLDDLHGLLSFLDTSVTAVHAEDRLLVSECWTRFDPIAARSDNPLFESFCKPANVTALVDYIPADATSFCVDGGADLRPLYRWVRGRVPAYVPESADGLLALEGIQALVDISIEDDLLSWIGSESVTISMPSKRPTAVGGEEQIMIVRLRDPSGAKKVLARIDAVYSAIVPQLLERLQAELGGQAVLPEIELRDAGGSFPQFKRLTLRFSIPQVPIPIPPIDVVIGVLGKQLVITSSEEALLRVMDVAAGEIDGIWDHPAMAGGRLPEGDITGLRFVPVGKQLTELTQGIAMGGGMAQMLLSQAGRGDPEVERMAMFVGDVLPRINGILASLNFLEDEVGYSETRDKGMTRYSRTTTRYRDN
ncbi:MAG: hypothetical protein DRQ55_07670 [Planctomycetota bacterium]|nr:MAG: hypothetical protein DRQ55_07670 [Planctomycetota bacterium]